MPPSGNQVPLGRTSLVAEQPHFLQLWVAWKLGPHWGLSPSVEPRPYHTVSTVRMLLGATAVTGTSLSPVVDPVSCG
jgi:hypothetical protein